MGMTLGKPFTSFFQENELKIAVFGLDGTGKSSILHRLKTGETLTSHIPTIGLSMETVKYKDSTLCFWELGGLERYKLFPLWKHYFQEVSGIVFVIDSTDIDRIEEATNFLDMVIEKFGLQCEGCKNLVLTIAGLGLGRELGSKIQGIIPDNVAVLIYGNKYEVPAAMSASKISNKLDLISLRKRNWKRNWHVQSSCALSGDGLHEGLDWLLKNAGRM